MTDPLPGFEMTPPPRFAAGEPYWHGLEVVGTVFLVYPDGSGLVDLNERGKEVFGTSGRLLVYPPPPPPEEPES